MLQLKKPGSNPAESDRQVRASVEAMLEHIDQRGETAIRELAKRFDGWEGEFVLGQRARLRLAPAKIFSRPGMGFRSL